MQSVMRESAPNDYGALLERVIGSLPDPSREARESIYARARTMLAGHFRASVSQASPVSVEREATALEAAIRRIESDYAARDVAARADAVATAGGREAAGADSASPRPSPGDGGPSGARARAPAAGRQLAPRPIDGAAASEVAASPRQANPAGVAVVNAFVAARSAVGGWSARVDPTLPVILEFQTPSASIVNAPIPRSARGVAWVITSMALALVVAAGLLSVDQVVTAKGIVISRSPTILVQPLETAIVRSIEVGEGQQVHAGDLLAKLDPTFAAADLGALTTQISSLSAESARLQAEAAGKPFVYVGDEADWQLQLSIFNHRQAEFRLRMENYKNKIDELSAVVARAKSDSLGYDARAEVATRVEQIRKELEAR